MKNSWNYRIVCKIWHLEDVIDKFGKKNSASIDVCSYGVHEVYYEDNIPGSLTTDISPGGETLEEFWKSTINYTEAFSKPVLYFDVNKDLFIEKPDWLKA